MRRLIAGAVKVVLSAACVHGVFFVQLVMVE